MRRQLIVSLIGARLIGFWAAGLMAVVLPAFGQAGASYDVVAFTGQPAPGGGQYSNFGLPKLGADGTVAFIDGIDAEFGTPRVVASFFGKPRLVAQAGQAAPESGMTYDSFSAVSVAFDGRVAFNGTTTGRGFSVGIFGENVSLALPTSFVDFGPAAFRAGNLVAIKGEQATGAESFAEVLGLVNGQGATTPLVEGQTLPGRSGNVLVRRIFQGSEGGADAYDSLAGTTVDANESGNVALKVLTTPGPSPTPFTVQNLYAGAPSALKRVATEGEPAPAMPGAYLNDLSPHPSIASDGHVAFSATIYDNSESSSTAVFAGFPGALQPIVRGGDAVPTTNGVTFHDVFGPAVVNETGDVIFKAVILYPNGGTREGIWIQRRSGGPVLIAANGVSLPTPSGNQVATSVDFAGPGTFNDLHQFVFRASFASGEGIYLADTRAVIPWVRVSYPRKPRDRVTKENSITIRGTAEDDTGIAKVEYTVQRDAKSRGKTRKKGKKVTFHKLAKGDKFWRFEVPLVMGINRISVTATDKLGNVSEPLVLRILRY